MNLRILKKLSKSDKYQIIYNRAKEIGSLKLFKNDNDLSKVQVWFLYYLVMYDNLYQDLAREEDYISEDVINDDIRCEAYLLYRKLKRNKKKDKRQRKIATGNDGAVVFRQRK